MEGYILTRRALGAMPNTPDDVVFLAAVIVALFSGALLIDWIRRIRDVGKQKHWHDTQMKALEKGFGTCEHLLSSLAAIQNSLIGLQGKSDNVSARIDDKSNRISELRQALDHIHKHQHQDFRELLVSVRTLQDTLSSTDYNTSVAPQPASTVQPNEMNLAFSDVRTSSTHPELPPVLDTSPTQAQAEPSGLSQSSITAFTIEPGMSTTEQPASYTTQIKETKPLHPKLDPYVARLQVEPSHLQSQCDALNAENIDLKQRLEAAQRIHAKIEENTKDAAEKHWKKLLDDEIRLNGIQKDNLQQIQDEMKDLLKEKDELAHTNAEMREEIERVEKSAENSKVDLQELRRLLADKNLAQKHLEEDIENQLSEAEDLKARLSLAEKEQTKTEREIKDLVNLHERAQLSATRKDAKIHDLNERLAAESSRLTRISTERDVITKENETMSGQMRALEEVRLRDKRQIDSLTKERDALGKQKDSLEQVQKERHKARERQKKALEHNEDAGDGSSSDCSKQTKDSEPDPNTRTTPHLQSFTSETTSNGELLQKPTQDAKTESSAPVAMDVITLEDKGPEQHMDAKEESENASEDTISPAKRPVASDTGDGEQVVGKRDWAEEDADADLSKGEVESFAAKTALLPTTASLGNPSIQRMPESPAAKPRCAFDDNQNEDVSDSNVLSSEPEASPATPGLIKAACRNCNADVLLETFVKHDGTRQPNWRKHLKQVHGKEKTPNQGFQSPGSGNSVASRSATPNPVAGFTIPARLDPRSDFILAVGHTHYNNTRDRGHVNAMCTLCDKRVALPFQKSHNGQMELDWKDHKVGSCITGEHQGSVGTGNSAGNNRGACNGWRGNDGRSKGPRIRRGRGGGTY